MGGWVVGVLAVGGAPQPLWQWWCASAAAEPEQSVDGNHPQKKLGLIAGNESAFGRQSGVAA